MGDAAGGADALKIQVCVANNMFHVNRPAGARRCLPSAVRTACSASEETALGKETARQPAQRDAPTGRQKVVRRRRKKGGWEDERSGGKWRESEGRV